VWLALGIVFQGWSADSCRLTTASRALGWRLVQEPGNGGYISEGVAGGVGVERARIPGCCGDWSKGIDPGVRGSDSVVVERQGHVGVAGGVGEGGKGNCLVECCCRGVYLGGDGLVCGGQPGDRKEQWVARKGDVRCGCLGVDD